MTKLKEKIKEKGKGKDKDSESESEEWYCLIPRKYVLKQGAMKRVPYDPEALKNAVQAVKDGACLQNRRKRI
ncbi:unnamed protein product [Leptosia nina]|uniref:Uncharacterized protein n=1 Tax=Leptosia nina TaxID=320188 RepID=A0AAV1K1G9_9NEOP